MTATQVKSLEMDASRKMVVVGSTGLFVFEIRVAVAFLQEELAVFHDQDGGAGDVGAFKLQRDDAVEEGFEVGGCELVGGGRSGGRSFVAGGAGLGVGFFGGRGFLNLRVRGGNDEHECEREDGRNCERRTIGEKSRVIQFFLAWDGSDDMRGGWGKSRNRSDTKKSDE
jgi:hypothetical protein